MTAGSLHTTHIESVALTSERTARPQSAVGEVLISCSSGRCSAMVERQPAMQPPQPPPPDILRFVSAVTALRWLAAKPVDNFRDAQQTDVWRYRTVTRSPTFMTWPNVFTSTVHRHLKNCYLCVEVCAAAHNTETVRNRRKCLIMCRLQWFPQLCIAFCALVLWVWRLFFFCLFNFIFLWRLLVLYFSLVAPAICYLFFLHVVLYVFLLLTKHRVHL